MKRWARSFRQELRTEPPRPFTVEMPRARRVSTVGLLLSFASLGGVSSCLYDSSHRCDEGQSFDAVAGVCVCEAALNLIAGEHGCVACGAHEVAANGACGCEAGYARTDGGLCKLPPEALGAACTDNAGCTDPTFNACHVSSAGSGYCTLADCSSDADCTGGYACNLSVTPSFCQKPPEGAGKTCASGDDCAGTAATYCETYKTHVCYVEGCSLTKNDCFPGKECCDLTGPSFGTIQKQICVDSGACGK